MIDDAPDNANAFTFAEKEQIARTTVLTLVKAQSEDGTPYYAYAAIPANRLEELIHVQQSGKVYKLQDYGRILAAGAGEPPPETQKAMEEKYGFYHERIITLSEPE